VSGPIGAAQVHIVVVRRPGIARHPTHDVLEGQHDPALLTGPRFGGPQQAWRRDARRWTLRTTIHRRQEAGITSLVDGAACTIDRPPSTPTSVAAERRVPSPSELRAETTGPTRPSTT